MKLFATTFLSLLVGAGLVTASPIQVTADLLNAGSPVLSDGNYDVSPYTLSVNGKSFAALCIDVVDWSKLNSPYTAYETSLLGGDLSKTYNPTDLKQYEEEAYLFNQITTTGADRINIQHAAWSITDPAYKANAAASVFVTQAAADYSTMNLSGFEIISGIDPTCKTRAQEFIIYTPSSAAPEPATFLLLGIGLAIMGSIRRKKPATK